jgi:hypothetical protein
MKNIAKDEKVMITSNDAAYKLLNTGDSNVNKSYPTLRNKLDLFFIDHEFIPLLIQDSYLNTFEGKTGL